LFKQKVLNDDNGTDWRGYCKADLSFVRSLLGTTAATTAKILTEADLKAYIELKDRDFLQQTLKLQGLQFRCNHLIDIASLCCELLPDEIPKICEVFKVSSRRAFTTQR
jgi:hypothetical protein